jgi:hypothetical protein
MSGANIGTAAALPSYVEYGGVTTTPPPDLIQNAVLYGLFPLADRAAMAALCGKVFAAPSAGAIRCTPIADRLLLTFGRANKVVPEQPPYNQMGYATESQVAFWIPILLERRNPQQLFDRIGFAWFIPYMWVDNPLSLSGGREIFGYAKNWGATTLPGDDAAAPQSFNLCAFGGNFDSASASKMSQLINLGPLAAAANIAAPSLTERFEDWLFGGNRMGLIGNDFIQLVSDFIHVGTTSIFLKQMRSVVDGTRADFQQITQTKTSVVKLQSVTPITGAYQMSIQAMDSHPIATDLGVASQTLRAGFKMVVDFELQAGKVLWPA